jgi:hypothetical protein
MLRVALPPENRLEYLLVDISRANLATGAELVFNFLA